MQRNDVAVPPPHESAHRAQHAGVAYGHAKTLLQVIYDDLGHGGQPKGPRIESQTQIRSHAGMTSATLPLFNGVPASTVHLPRGDWSTVLDALCARFPRIAREQWRDRMDRGVVLDADGRSIEAERAYRFGMRVHYFREVATETRIPFEATVLHHDAHLVIAANRTFWR